MQDRVAATTLRVPEYDLARVVSIACVVLIHVIAPFVAPETAQRGGTGPMGLLSRELRFAVPMFVLITGALLWSRPFGGAADWRTFFTRRFTTVLLPYAAWSVLFVAVGQLLGIKPFLGIGSFLQQLLVGATWYHLYFVPPIVGIYVLTPLVGRVCRAHPVMVAVTAIAIGVVVPPLLTDLGWRSEPVWMLVAWVAAYVPYAALGALYASERENGRTILARSWPVVLAVALAGRAWLTFDPGGITWRHGVFLADIAVNALPSLAVLAGLAALLRRRPGLEGRIAPWAVCVFGVYLGHPMLLLGLEGIARLTGMWPAPLALWVMVVWPTVLLVSFAAVRFASRWSRVWWLHGVPPRRRRDIIRRGSGL